MWPDASDTEPAALRAAFGHVPLGPPLGPAGVREREEAFGVTLPEPYRSLVAVIGDGCPGGPPFYGLLRLDDSLTGGDGSVRAEGIDLTRPFPLTETWAWRDDPRPDAVVEPLVAEAWTSGTLPLGTDGCGMDWRLVITGPQRGRVWWFCEDGAQPLAGPFSTAGPGLLGWVRHWAAGRDWFDTGG
ncbi:hypothetical protein [Marinactinospora rubrisoli]|uniref:Knr4/Smi1-like domain-containing protein n=1 Tax=Marinactinospora rubrisoli TaxID=2715399 RepID=A0ABW2KES5_9ACTN